EVVNYLRGLVAYNFQAHRAEAKNKMLHQFNNELQKPLEQMWENIGINPNAVQPEDFADSWLNNMQSIVEGTHQAPTVSVDDNLKLKDQVDEVLRAMLEEVQKREADIPEACKEEIRNFPRDVYGKIKYFQSFLLSF